MPTERYNAWGRPLSEYFLRNPTNAFFPPDKQTPSAQYIKNTAIPSLQYQALSRPSFETRVALEGVLSLIRRPRDLRVVKDTVLFKRCMEFLRDFTRDADRDGKRLFSYEFGFLCFRVIVLLIQVGILLETSKLGDFAAQTNHLSDPQEIAAALSKFAAQIILDAYEGDENPRNKLFHTWTSQRGGRMFLRNVGGFYDTDVDFFLNAIWQDRKTLSMISAQTTFSGWSFALLALGEHMRWAGEVGVRKTGEQWGQLQTLSFRGMLTTPNSEEVSCLSEICYDLPSYQFQPTEEDYIVSLVDSEDARTVLETYNRRMLSSPDQDRLIVDNVSSILRFVTQDVMTDFRDLHPDFVKATGRWLWEEIDENGTSADFLLNDEKLVECVTHMLRFTRQSYFALKGANSKEIATLTKGLSEADFINLAGRIILVPTALGTTINQFDNSEDSNKSSYWLDTEASWTTIVEEAIKLGVMYSQVARSANDQLARLYPSWIKTWRCFQAGFPHHPNQTTWFQNYVKGCDLAWATLGQAVGYVDRSAKEQTQCAYQRCQGPLSLVWVNFTCGRCLSAAYCSRRCQSGHWSSPIDPHKEECSEVEPIEAHIE